MTLRAKTALVVDDELPVRALLVRSLSGVGFECVQASNGEEALEHLANNQFDLVVTDLRMPKVHGHALCLDVLERNPRPILVVLTGVLEPRLWKDLESRGVDLVKTKPINFRKFADEVTTLVDRRRANSPEASPSSTRSESERTPAFSAKEVAAKGEDAQVIGVLMKDAAGARGLIEQLKSDGVHVLTANNSDSFYQMVSEDSLDVAVLENEQQGFLSGMGIVERLGEKLNRLRVILIGEANDKLRQRAENHSIVLVDPSSGRPNLVAATIKKALAEVEREKTIIPPQARQLVDDFGDFPPLPQLIVKLAGYLSMPHDEIPLEELAQDISSDAQATSDLLRFTNNASLGLRGRMTSVLPAVTLHGPGKTISLVLAAAAVNVQSGALDEWNETLRQWYQKRSSLLAATASTFANYFEKVQPDTAFLLGLIQSVGSLVLSRAYGDKYDQLVYRFREVAQVQLHHIENETFGIQHAQVSAALLKKWDFPESLIRPLVSSTLPEGFKGLTEHDLACANLLSVGTALANAAEVCHPYRTEALNRTLRAYLQQDAEQCQAALAESLDKSRQCSELLSFPVPEKGEIQNILKHAASAIDTPSVQTAVS